MEPVYSIRNYCMIRNHQVIKDGKVLLDCDTVQPASFFTEVYKYFGLNYPKFYKMDNLCKLGFLTAEILLRDADLSNRFKANETGLVLYNAASSLDTDRNHQQSISDRLAYFPSPSVFVYTLANIVIGELSIRHKLHGEGTFFIEEQFDPRRLDAYVRLLFEEKVVESCITGWLELDGDQYDAILYLVEKTASGTGRIAIFDAENLKRIYMHRS